MSNDLTAMMQSAADDDEKFGGTEVELNIISRLAQECVDEKKVLAELEAKVSESKAKIKAYEEDKIPSAMDDANLKKFTLKDGSEITTKPEIYISIPKDKQQQAYAWLAENGHGSIVKHDIGCVFGKGEQAEADRFRDMIAGNGFSFHDKESVHAQTLKSWARQESENGRTPPEDIFNVYEVTVAKIKPAK